MNHGSCKMETSRKKGPELIIIRLHVFKYQSRKNEGFAESGRLENLVREILFEGSASLVIQSGDAAFSIADSIFFWFGLLGLE